MDKARIVSLGGSALLVLAVVTSVVFGADTRAWTWGGAMVLLGMALAISAFIPDSGRNGKVWWVAALATLWFLARAATSPVLDFARGDAFLALIFFGGATVACCLAGSPRALAIFSVGLAILTLGNVAIAWVQWVNPDFSWPYPGRPMRQPSGFFGHYNYFANFTIGVTAFLASRLIFAQVSVGERIILALAVLAGIAGVAISESRGAILGASIAFAVFLTGGFILLWRARDRTSSKIGLVFVPIVLILGVVAALFQTSAVLEQRAAVAQEGMTDNISRFNYYELAIDTWSENPWIGGGSRSFSWLRNSHWDVLENGSQSSAEPHVHNEFLQAATDYGVIGALLGLLVVGVLLWSAISLLMTGAERSHPRGAEWICLGAISGSLGILTQANVSFVFHLSPAVLLIGIYLGLVQGVTVSDRRPKTARFPAALLRGVGCLLAVSLIGFGVLASWVHRQVWPLVYTQERVPLYALEESITEAIKWWPGFQLPEMWASRLQTRAGESEVARRELLDETVSYYRVAADYHPYDPSLAVNLANVLSVLGRNREATEAYRQAIRLQGTLENAYHARFEWAQHLYRKSYRLWVEERRPEEALTGFLRAREELEKTAPDAGDYFRRGEGRPFLDQVNSAISFLEEAGIRAAEEGAANPVDGD